MPFPYLYDPTGLLPANAITAELHHVAPPVDLDRANFIVPRAAPYFATGLVIRTGVTVGSPTLVEGVDYIYTHHFVEASQHLSTPVYGTIMFLNRAYVGDVYVSYHTLGGAYTLDDYGVVETLTRSLYNIRTVTWDQLIGVPVAFPVVPHPHDVADLTGMTEVVTAIQNLAIAIQGQDGNIGSLMSTLVNHIDGIAVHTKAQVGLPYVENYGMAGPNDLDTKPNNKYASPAWVWSAIELFSLGEAGVSQASDTVVGITRYATDVEVADQDNPLDNVAVSAAGMWLAIATNTERLAGATIVTGVDFNTPPYREDGYWAFTNAINTSITPSSGYICTKKAGTKAYQTETLDNGEISNRMYTGTTWTPWIRAYVATYYGSIPVNTLAGNVDLNDYTVAGFYTFDTHNVIGHAPPSFGVPSLHEMMVYASDVTPGARCQVALNLTANISTIRSKRDVGYGWSAWHAIDNITGVLPSTVNLPITSPGVWLIKNDDFMVVLVTADPVTNTILNFTIHPLVDNGLYATHPPVLKYIDDGLPGRVWEEVPIQVSVLGVYFNSPSLIEVDVLYIACGVDLLAPSNAVMLDVGETVIITNYTGMIITSTGNNINTPLNLLPNRLYLLTAAWVAVNWDTLSSVGTRNDLTVFGVEFRDLVTNKTYFNGRLDNGYGWTGWILKSAITDTGSELVAVDIDTLTPHSFTRTRYSGIASAFEEVVVFTTTYSDGVYQRRHFEFISQNHPSGTVRVKPTTTGVWGPWL